MSRTLFAVIDCNNFFVSCEKVFRPDLEGRPVVVLSNNDGCAVSRSNEAKAIGIPMGSPAFKYKNLYDKENVVAFSANFSLYGDFSERVNRVIERHIPPENIEVYSIDESFMRLDRLQTQDIKQAMVDLRADIERCTGIPVSIGIASTKTLAKAAVEYGKKHPAGGYVEYIDSENERQEVLKWLPVEDVWGIGRRIAPTLQAYGIRTAWDYANLSQGWIREHYKSNGTRLHQELHGQPMHQLETERLQWRKSIAATRSFGQPVTQAHQLEQALASYIARAARKLRRQGGVAKRIDIYARSSKGSFSRMNGFKASAGCDLPVASSDTRVLTAAAIKLVPELYRQGVQYAKAGIMLNQLSHEPQLSLTETYDATNYTKQQALMASVDALNRKWGDSAVRLGREGIHQSWRSKRQRSSPAYTQSWNQLPVVKA